MWLGIVTGLCQIPTDMTCQPEALLIKLVREGCSSILFYGGLGGGVGYYLNI